MTVTPSPAIAPLPTAPSRQRPETFSAEMDAFLGAMDGFGDDVQAVGEAVQANATAAETAASTAETKAAEALASANAAVNAPGTSATSTTSLSVGSGARSPTLAQTGKDFAVGQPVRIARTSAASTTWMQGIVTAFNSGTGAMTVAVSTFAGTGTHTDWTISLTGPDALPAASAAEVRAGTESAKAVTPASQVGSAAFQTLTDAATINWNTALGYNAYVTLGGNRAMAAPTNMQDGLPYQLFIDQGAAGNRTLSWDSIFDWRDLGVPTLSTGANKVDIASGTYCAATGKLHMTGFSKAA